MENRKVYKPSEKEEVILKLEVDNTELECVIIYELEYKTQKYIALLPLNKQYVSQGKLLLYKVIDNVFTEIFNDEEYEFVLDSLNEILGDQGYYELIAKYSSKFNNDNKDV